jgi:hypothetical protein
MIIFNTNNRNYLETPLFTKANLVDLFKKRKFEEIENKLLTVDTNIKKWFCAWVDMFLDNIAQELKAVDSEFYCELYSIYDTNLKIHNNPEDFEFIEQSIVYDRIVLLHLWINTYYLAECRKGYSDLYTEGTLINCNNLQFEFFPTKSVLDANIEQVLKDFGFVVEII